MSRGDTSSGLIAVIAGLTAVSLVGVAAVAAFGRKGVRMSPLPLPRSDSAPKPDDVEALARCLASEDADPAIQVAIGWICIQVAKRRRQTVSALLTGGHGYGPQKIWVDGRSVIRFASTDKPPTDSSMLLTHALLSGAIGPSESLQKAAPTSFVERSRASKRLGADGRPLQPETPLVRIIALQADFGGLVGRMGRWYFYRHKASEVSGVEAIPNLA